uniref:Uncharacterized protein n=1 Tax=Anguilla anguilla TaxID=7936 RepID=A0A0E9TAF0_ANGAN
MISGSYKRLTLQGIHKGNSRMYCE